MSGQGPIPTAVLSQRLVEAIGGRRVRSAVFTTFSFDPGFFELHILPLLFDQSFSQVDKVRRIQLEDALRQVDHLAVYYDRSALAQEGEPAQLDFRRLDVGRKTGAFHPKVVMLLLDELPEDGESEVCQALIVGILSANLTRSGWWENVECAHFEEVKDWEIDGKRCSFRQDLLPLLQHLKRSTGAGEEQSALEDISTFLKQRTNRAAVRQASSQGQFFTRVFCGQQSLSFSDWLVNLRIDRQEWNLEIISPFFDPTGEGPLLQLLETLQPRETRIHLPREGDGTASITPKTFHAIQECATWSSLPGEILSRGRSAEAEKLPPRRVHAKVYRLWHGRGRDLLILGSPNLTGAAHSRAQAGNLETAILIDVTDHGFPRRWWLQPLEEEPTRFPNTAPSEESGTDDVPVALSVRFDWGKEELAVRVEQTLSGGITLCDLTGKELVTLDGLKTGGWKILSPDSAQLIRQQLTSSSFLQVIHQRGAWRVLIREEALGHRPSLLTRLSAAEILEYWALLTPDQRATFLEVRVGVETNLEGLEISKRDPLAVSNTLFDRYAGIYHSFGCLKGHLAGALKEGREREAEALLMGARYDSLPSLLEKTLTDPKEDPVQRYVTLLSAVQVVRSLQRQHATFFQERQEQRRRLEGQLAQLEDLRRDLGIQEDADDFLEWFEPLFLHDLSQPGAR